MYYFLLQIYNFFGINSKKVIIFLGLIPKIQIFLTYRSYFFFGGKMQKKHNLAALDLSAPRIGAGGGRRGYGEGTEGIRSGYGADTEGMGLLCWFTVG